MYTLFSNEKLGMSVEDVRLREIRQEIVSRRLAEEVQNTRSDHANRPGRWLNQVKAWLTPSEWRPWRQKDLPGDG